MDKKYYISLVCAFLLCAVFPTVFYFFSSEKNEEKKHIESVYSFETVQGPIQPIPRKLIIDKD
ncbi:MAG: hypothetical protein ACI9YH_004666 [Colwellia sp.]|jgi:hypothetical protein